MRLLLRVLLTREATTLALMITALACLPFALRKVLPDAAMTLLLPVVLVGAILGFAAHTQRIRWIWFRGIYLGAGPAILFVRVGQLSAALITSTFATLRIITILMLPSQSAARSMPELTVWLAAQSQLFSEVVTFVERIVSGLADMLRRMPVDDPAARAFLYGLGLWFLAGWASWRIRDKHDPLGGLLPASVLLALILVQSAEDRWIFWLNLSAFLLLLGVANLSRLITSWKSQQTDFSDSISEDSILSSVLMVSLLIGVAYAASTFSMKDLLDRFREHEEAATVSSGGAPNTSARSARSADSGIIVNLQSDHRITGGPQLSRDVVMLISTGDLPPMQNAFEIPAPDYHWRNMTYETYTGSGWKNPPAEIMQVPAHTQLLSAQPANYRKMHQVVAMVSGASGGAY